MSEEAMTIEEIRVVMALLDAGVKTIGIQLFKDDGAALLKSALTKLQRMAEVKDSDQKP